MRSPRCAAFNARLSAKGTAWFAENHCRNQRSTHGWWSSATVVEWWWACICARRAFNRDHLLAVRRQGQVASATLDGCVHSAAGLLIAGLGALSQGIQLSGSEV